MALALSGGVASASHGTDRVFVVSPEAPTTLRLTCVAGETTRVLLPEPLRRLKGLGVAREALGVAVERSSPTAILTLHPARHPARGVLEFQGTSLALRLEIATSEEGAGIGGDVRVSLPATPTVEEDAVPSTPGPTVSAEASEPVEPSPRGPARPREPLGGLDVAALLAASPQRIDRREGLPGQPELRLVDALEAEQWTFFRLRLQDGVKAGVRRIRWDSAELDTYETVPEGDDLLIVVQVPRDHLTDRGRLEIETGAGIVYRLKTTAPTLPARIRELFR